MANNRELARVVSSKIWRTVVVAGAMLATPVVAGCGGASKPETVAPIADNTAGADQAAADKTAADKTAADKAAADKAAADSKAAAEAYAVAYQAAAEEKAAAAAAEKAAADKAAADKAAAEAAKQPRPRTNDARPKGRGFVLS